MITAKTILSAIEAAEDTDKQKHYRSIGILNSADELTFIPIGCETFKYMSHQEIRSFKEEASKLTLVWTDEYQKSRKTKGFIVKSTIGYVKSLARRTINQKPKANRQAPIFNRQNLASLEIEKRREHDAGNGEFVKRAMSHRTIQAYKGSSKHELEAAKAHGVFKNTTKEYRGLGRTHTVASNIKTEVKRSMLKAGTYINFDIRCSHLRENLKRLPIKSPYIHELIETPDIYQKLLTDSGSSLDRKSLKSTLVKVQNSNHDRHITKLDNETGNILSSLVPELVTFLRENKGNVDEQYGFCSKKETQYLLWIANRLWALGLAFKNEFDGGLVQLKNEEQASKVEAILNEAESLFGIFIKRETWTIEQPTFIAETKKNAEEIKRSIDDIFSQLEIELGLDPGKTEASIKLEQALNELDQMTKKREDQS